MNSDIDNWVDFLNETISKSNIPGVSFNNKGVIRDLKLSAVPMLKQFIGNVTGRNLTSLLKDLENSFQQVSKQLKKEKSLDDFRKLSFIALSNVIVDIVREVRVEAYSEGKDFDPIEFLDNYENRVTEEINKERKKKVINKLKLNKKENQKKSKKKNSVEEESSDEEEIEEDSDDDDDDSDYKPQYLDDEEDDEDYEDEEESEESNDEETLDKRFSRKRKGFIVKGTGKKNDKKAKLDLEFMNSMNSAAGPKSYEDHAFSHFSRFNEEQKREFLDRFKIIADSVDSTEPVLFKIVNMDLPIEQKNNILSEYMNVESAIGDRSKLKTWLDNVMKLPFGKYKGTDLDKLKEPEEIKDFIISLNKTMDEAVWGHNEAKKKIIEIMVQYITNPESKGSCLGLWGPPGNGKTTLIKEGIAKTMGREFVFISLGGAQDSEYLEGFSFTYEGSTYGRIAQGLMKCECMNPIFYFDELDKVSQGYKGREIINLLVHLIDPAQNSEFVDKYFHNLKLDLSKATFIFSYNDPSLIDPILKDRITEVNTKYLLLNEKIKIGQNYLLPGIVKDMGLKEGSFNISDNLISSIVGKYTREGGVRKLKAIFYSMLRQLNILQLTNEKLNGKLVKWPYHVNKNDFNVLLKDFDKIDLDKIHTESKVGVINGMWAGSLGIGGVLPIESSWIPAQNRNYIKATGSLENVIKESIEVANTLAWNHLDKKVKKKYEEEFKEVPFGIHVHCPEGAVPKDGPSAGTALTVLFYSLYTNKKIKNDIAITGEINLRGEVLKIGGLEEKLQGAKKAGVKLALIPNQNLKDLDKIKERNPNLIDNTFKIMDIENIKQVLEKVLV